MWIYCSAKIEQTSVLNVCLHECWCTCKHFFKYIRCHGRLHTSSPTDPQQESMCWTVPHWKASLSLCFCVQMCVFFWFVVREGVHLCVQRYGGWNIFTASLRVTEDGCNESAIAHRLASLTSTAADDASSGFCAISTKNSYIGIMFCFCFFVVCHNGWVQSG